MSAAFVDDALEQPGRRRRDQIGHDGGGAARLAEDRHIAGVTAEFGDIGLHPFQRELQVHQPIIAEIMALAVERRMGEKAQRADAEINRDHDRVALARQLAAVIVVALARD